MSEVTWYDVVQAADALIATYAQLMNKQPEHGVFYQEQMAIAMFKRQEAAMRIRKQERREQHA